MMNFFKKIWNWIKGLIFDKKIEYKDEVLLTLNSCCSKCGSPMNYLVTGVVTVYYEWHTAGIRENQTGHGNQEYQFHYNKCPKCGEWQMYEYRETPSWWDDLWRLDCPFTKGDIIKKWQNNEFNLKKYKGHTITKW